MWPPWSGCYETLQSWYSCQMSCCPLLVRKGNACDLCHWFVTTSWAVMASQGPKRDWSFHEEQLTLWLYEHLRGFVVGLLPWKTPMYVNVGGDGSWQLKFPNWLGKSGWGKEVIFFPFNNSNQDALQKGILNFSLQDRLQFQCLPLDSVSRMWNTWSYSYCCWVKLLSCYLIVTNSVVSNCRYTLLWQTVSLLPLTSVFYLASCFLAATLLGLIFTSGPNRT